mgnify:CR=1 FL=1
MTPFERANKEFLSKMDDALFSSIYATLHSMLSNELIKVHNEYCFKTDSQDSIIYEMFQIDNCEEIEPLELARLTYDGKFNPYNKYYGIYNEKPVSFNSVADDDYFIFPEEITDYIIENNDALGNDKIANILKIFG